jgi:hypothetical protein
MEFATMRTTRWAVTLALCIPVALSSFANSLMAQQRPYPTVPGYTPVIIAVAENFPYSDTDAVIVRRRTLNDRDVIFGDVPAADQVVRVQEQRTPRGRVAEAAKWMRRINDAAPREVAELGNLKYVRILLPNSQ